MILPDRHIFLWWMADDRRLGKRSRQLVLSRATSSNWVRVGWKGLVPLAADQTIRKYPVRHLDADE